VTALAALIVNRLRGCHSFHDAPLRPLDSLDFQPFPAQVIEGLAQERIVLQPHEWFQHSLDDPHRRDGTPHVLQEQRLPSGLRTRLASATALRSSWTEQSDSVQTTVSKVSSGNSRA
jgi:hypothetical protein